MGATQVRRMVLGDADVEPTASQLGAMKALVEQAMRDGAVGVSSALQYAPAPYARTPELIALAGAAAPFGGIYATHICSEGDGVLDSIDEAARIGREAHVPVEIWHLKAAGRANWGRMPQIVAKIDQYRAAGVDISADTYAYTAHSQGHDDSWPRCHRQEVGQRVAGDPGSCGNPDRRGAES